MPLCTIETEGKLEPFVRREWLLTNGMGAFAGSTIVGCNTRRYHSLLCAALNPPLGRVNCLSRIAERVVLAGQTFELSCNQFRDLYHPRGDQHLLKFEMDETVKWHYQVGEVRITKELLLCWRRNVCGIRYTITPARQPLRLELLPFVALRDFHAIRRGGAMRSESLDGSVRVSEGELSLHLLCDAGEWREQGEWWHGHFYRIEAERGLDNFEDLWSPGRFVLECPASHGKPAPRSITIWASPEGIEQPDWDEEMAAREEALARAEGPLATASAPVTRRLLRAASDFVVARKTPSGEPGTTVLAGYPWFSDWGRDTMISLPGLLLVSRRFEEARQVLCVFAEYVSEGMIPNVFGDRDNVPHYNTVDASLWFIHAVHEYHRLAGDEATYARKLRPACQQILDGYRHGTRFGIHMDTTDGLIMQGDASTQLTWMDAKCDGIAFTPRQGKAVEINALWYHALVLMGESKLAAHTRDGFRKAFWISPFRGLYDVVLGEHRDASVRPNQIFAASLANSPLDLHQQRAVVEVVRRELLTPYGLRTLARSDSRYVGRFEGDARSRDRAYHNGAVWPWLIGPFLEAYLKTHDRSSESLEQAKKWLTPLLMHLDEGACVGQVSEIYDGDIPQRPGGCPAQAWSVAEVLRLANRLNV